MGTGAVMIKYRNTLEGVTPTMLDGFFVGWPSHPDNGRFLDILKGSAAVWLAFDDGRCVGFVNALSDGVYYSYIPLLEVLPEYQGRGIGTDLVRRMKESLKDMYAIDICCDDGVVPFYQRLGFFRGNSMIARNFDKQGG